MADLQLMGEVGLNSPCIHKRENFIEICTRGSNVVSIGKSMNETKSNKNTAFDPL